MPDAFAALNKEQEEAVKATEGPLLILAGAGTGKTKTLINRAAYIMSKGVPGSKILMLTFTNKAAGEMVRRLEDMTEAEASGVTACTYHSFCAMLIHMYGDRIGISHDYTILSGNADDISIIDMTKATHDKKRYDFKGFPPPGTITAMISTSINTHRVIEDVLADAKYLRFAPFCKEIKEIAEGAAEYKEKNNLLNYKAADEKTHGFNRGMTARYIHNLHILLICNYQKQIHKKQDHGSINAKVNRSQGSVEPASCEQQAAQQSRKDNKSG